MTHMVPTVEQVNCNCQKTELPPSSDGQNQAHRLYLSKISKTEELIVYSCMKQDGGLTLKGMTNRRHRIILGTGNNLSFHFW